MSEVADLVGGSIMPYAEEPIDVYSTAFRKALASHPPVFGEAWYGNTYRQLARNIDWFVTSLVTNAEREGFGSRQIWKFSNLIHSDTVMKLVRQHSLDEARHSRMFVKLLELCIPSGVSPSTLTEIRNFSPKFSYSDVLSRCTEEQPLLSSERVLDEMIQINLVEVRSLVLQRLLRPVVQTYYEGTENSKILSILDTLLSDECRHIEYSARCIQWLGMECGVARMQELMILRQGDLNRITLAEMDDRTFE